MVKNTLMQPEVTLSAGIETSEIATGGASQPLRLFTLHNKRGTRVTLCNLGASLYSIHTPDRQGRSENILLTYADPQHWLDNKGYLGVTAGRVANRIGRARFTLNGTTYRLPANDGEHHLHGGLTGVHTLFWELVQGETSVSGQSVTFRCVSEDGVDGYPGKLVIELTYRLSERGELTLDFSAVSDADTPVNLTNHGYWNLQGLGEGQGEGQGNILSHELTIHADQLLAVDDALIPTGELMPVDGTPVDFRMGKTIGEDIHRWAGGYDNFWVVDATAEKKLKAIATLTDPVSGRRLDIYSSEAGVQFYSGNFLDGSRKRDSGAPMQRHAGLCLETHGFPDAPNHPHFPSIFLKKGDTYRHTTVFQFSVE